MCTVLLPPGGYPIAVKYIILFLAYRKDRNVHTSYLTQAEEPTRRQGHK